MDHLPGIDNSISGALGIKVGELVKDRPRITARPENSKDEIPQGWDDLSDFKTHQCTGFGARAAVFEKPAETVNNELKALKKLGEDSYFGKQRQYDELKQFSHRLNERIDLNATRPELMVWTTPRFAYSDKHLAAMLDEIGKLKAGTNCREERALLEGMERSIQEAQKERAEQRHGQDGLRPFFDKQILQEQPQRP